MSSSTNQRLELPLSILEPAVLLLLPCAVLAYGGVHTGSRLAITAVLLVTAIALMARSRYEEQRLLGTLAAVALLVAALPLVPVGSGVRVALMGGIAGPVESVLGLTEQTARPLALAPWRALLGWAEAAALMLFGVGVAGWSTRAGRNVRLVWSSVGTGVAVVLIMVVHQIIGADSIYGMGLGEHNREGFYAPFVNPNHGGIFLAALVPLCITRLAHGRPMERVVAALAASAFLFGVWTSGSRGAVTAAGVGVLVVLAAAGGRRLRWTVGSLAVACVGTAGAAGPERVLEWLSAWVAPSVSEMADAGYVTLMTGRVELTQASVKIATEVPLIGVGSGGYATALRMVREGPAFNAATHAHNEYLQVAAEQGLLGLAALVAVLVIVVRVALSALQRWERRPDRRWLLAGWLGALAAMATASLADFPMRLHSHAILAVFGLGSVVGLARPQRGGRRLSRPVWRGSVVVAILGLMATAAVGHGGVSHWSNPQHSQDSGEQWVNSIATGHDRDAALKAAVGHFERAAIRGLRRHAFQWLARVRALQGRYSEADRVLQVGTDLDPTMPWLWRDRARLAQRNGEPERARVAWGRLLSLDLPVATSPADVIREALFGGDFETPMIQARAILPERADRHRQAAHVMDQVGLRDDAEVLFRRALSMEPSAVNRYAEALMKWGRPHDAVMLLEPNLRGCFAHRTHAQGLLRLGRYADAADAYQEAIGVCGAGVWEIRKGVCHARLMSGDPRGEDVVEELLRVQPEAHQLRRVWLWILSRRGRTVDGVRHLSMLKDLGAIRPVERLALQRASEGLPFRVPEPSASPSSDSPMLPSGD